METLPSMAAGLLPLHGLSRTVCPLVATYTFLGKETGGCRSPSHGFLHFFPLKNGNYRAGATQLISVTNDRSSGHL